MSDPLVGALVEAIRDGDVPEVARLLKIGADPNGVDSEGDTPLVAAASERSGEESARLLLDAGADPNLGTETRWATTPLISAAGHGSPSMVKLLLERGADPNLKSSRGSVALCGCGTEVISLLLEAGADPNLESTAESEGLPLCFAATWGDVQAVQTLLEGGADPGVTESGGWTPLDWAKRNAEGYARVIELVEGRA